MKIIIGADIVPTKSNFELFSAGNAKALVGSELSEVLSTASYRIFNLEVPLTNVEKPISKCGPNLIAPEECIAGYKSLGIDLLTLANNHILDQGVQGLNNTLKVLEQANIAYTGVGQTLEEATVPYMFKFGDKTIGVYACAEHEFSIASEHSAGVNPIDLLESPDHIEALKKQCDFVIVLYHGGKEHYRYPSPNVQKTCRKLVDKGADLVVCQHSHCIGCEEKYQGATIVYGQGNFLFDDSESECWQTSLLIVLDEKLSVSYIPLQKNKNTVRIAEGENAKKILNDFRVRCEQIHDREFVETMYNKFAQEMFSAYLCEFTSKHRNIVFRVLNRLTSRKWGYHIAKKIPRNQKLKMLNFIDCEAHRELFVEGLKNACK